MSVPAAYLGIILIWSTTPLAVKWSGEGAGFLFGASARMILGTVLCLVVLRVLKTGLPWHRQAIQTYAASSVGIYGAMMCVYWGAQFIPSGLISVLFGLTPLLTGLMAHVMLQERGLSPSRLLGIAIGIGGLIVLFRTDLILQPGASQGIAAVLAATVLHSLSTVLVKRSGSELPAMTVNGGGLLFASGLYLVSWLLFEGTLPTDLPLRAGLSILYLGVFGTVLGFSLYFYALRHLPANRIGLIPLITPAAALMLGQALNNESIDTMVWLGAGTIGLGLMVYEWGDRAFGRFAWRASAS